MDIDDAKATLASLINNKTLVLPENPRDPGSHLYRRILYVFGMTPKLMSVLRRMRHFTEEQIDEHINWFNLTFDATVTRVKEISYAKTKFGPRISGIHEHTKLMEAESATFNESKLIQEWVDEEIKYPYTPMDLGNQKYQQTIARTGFTEEIVTALTERGFSNAQVEKHIRIVRQRFGFDVRTAGSRRGKHTPPEKLPELIFIEEKRKEVPVTSSATPATQSLGKPSSSSDTGTDTVEKTIGSITMSGAAQSLEEGRGLPVISTVFSLSTTEDMREKGMEVEHVSTITKDYEPFDPKERLTSKDLQIKKEMVDEDLHPGDPGYYSRLQYVYQNWKKAERMVETTRNTTQYVANLQKCHSIGQILENMKTAYAEHAKRVGKILPRDWDTVGLEKPTLPRGARGMEIPIERDLDYNPEPISHLKPNSMGMAGNRQTHSAV